MIGTRISDMNKPARPAPKELKQNAASATVAEGLEPPEVPEAILRIAKRATRK